MNRETWDEVQAILTKQCSVQRAAQSGPGCASLQGILACELHGERSLSVDYRERLRDGRDEAFYYHCHGTYELGAPQRVVFPGRPLDVAVARAVFGRLTRPSLEVIAAEWEKEKRIQIGATKACTVAVEQARRGVEDLRSHYLSVNPALRDLAEDLEIQLNRAIGDYKHAQSEAASVSSAPDPFTTGAFAELVSLCEELPALFYAATTTPPRPEGDFAYDSGASGCDESNARNRHSRYSMGRCIRVDGGRGAVRCFRAPANSGVREAGAEQCGDRCAPERDGPYDLAW